MTVTASQIKDEIDQALAGAGITTVRVYDYAQIPNRRSYPCIEIVNAVPSDEQKDPRVTKVDQSFTVTLSIRIRGAGSTEVELQTQVETAVLNAIDDLNLSGDIIVAENRRWNRSPNPITRPVPHYQSTLTVLVTKLSSTTGQGTLGDEMTFSVPGLTDMPLLSKPLEREVSTHEDIYDDTRTRKTVAPITDTRSFFAEVEHTISRMTTLRNLRDARAKIACTLKRKTVPENFNGKIVALSSSASYTDVETITIQVEVIP